MVKVLSCTCSLAAACAYCSSRFADRACTVRCLWDFRKEQPVRTTERLTGHAVCHSLCSPYGETNYGAPDCIDVVLSSSVCYACFVAGLSAFCALSNRGMP